ncbi:MAG: hypothetical protein RMJ55_18525, partial [Roseiflexaceae bacterium]|nr:hypothetical protein [Roseiflexaceae bacterium]
MLHRNVSAGRQWKSGRTAGAPGRRKRVAGTSGRQGRTAGAPDDAAHVARGKGASRGAPLARLTMQRTWHVGRGLVGARR